MTSTVSDVRKRCFTSRGEQLSLLLLMVLGLGSQRHKSKGLPAKTICVSADAPLSKDIVRNDTFLQLGCISQRTA